MTSPVQQLKRLRIKIAIDYVVGGGVGGGGRVLIFISSATLGPYPLSSRADSMIYRETFGAAGIIATRPAADLKFRGGGAGDIFIDIWEDAVVPKVVLSRVSGRLESLDGNLI